MADVFVLAGRLVPMCAQWPVRPDGVAVAELGAVELDVEAGDPVLGAADFEVPAVALDVAAVLDLAAAEPPDVAAAAIPPPAARAATATAPPMSTRRSVPADLSRDMNALLFRWFRRAVDGRR